MEFLTSFVLFTYGLIVYLFVGFIYVMEVHERFTCRICQEFDQIGAVYDYIVGESIDLMKSDRYFEFVRNRSEFAVGCGSAGSIVSLRLAEMRNVSVLVIEAGPEGNSLLDIPAVGPALQRTRIDWQYETVPQTNSSFAFNNHVIKWPTGRVVGGSGRLNNMIYLRGHSSRYADWYKDLQDFDFERDILKYFKKSEDFHVPIAGDRVTVDEYHSESGPLRVEDLKHYSCLTRQVLKAARRLGYSVHDLNRDEREGFMKVQVTMKSGSRWTPSHHLLNKKPPNLTLLTLTTAKKILFKSNFEAYGVEISRAGEKRILKARKGIVLSAGAVGSPRILLSSGVGPKSHLQDVGIRLVKDLPVGENLHDHVATGLDLILLNKSMGMTVNKMLSPVSIFDYFVRSKGPWSAGGCEVVGIVSTDDDRSNLQLMVLPAGISGDGGYYLKDNFNINETVWRDYFAPIVASNVVTILAVVLKPKSRGRIRLADKDWSSKPLIDPGYLRDGRDANVLLQGIDLIKRLIATEPMIELGAKLNPNKFPGCEEFVFDSPPYWRCYVKYMSQTVYHPVGTCKMGNALNEDTVVDRRFKVKGTNKLYVADASVIPEIPNANPNAAVIMLAEKAARSVLTEQFLNENVNYLHDLLELKELP